MSISDNVIELYSTNRELEKRIIESLSAAIYVTDAEGRLTYYNSAAVEFSGREPEVGTDRWCVTMKLYHPDGTPMPHEKCPMAVSLKENRSIDGAEAVAELPNGKRRWFKAYPTPLHNDNGDIIGGINMLVDISEQKKAEEKLLQNEKELNDFFENANVGIHWVTVDGIIKRVNQAELDLLGYSREEYVGSHIADFHADEDVIDDILTRLVNREELHDYQARLQCKDGSIKHVLINSSVYEEDGEFVHTRCITRDITERKRTELLQEEQNNLLELITSGAPLEECLTKLCNAIPKFSSGIRAAVLPVDEERKTFKRPIAPDLDTSFIDGLKDADINDPNLGTCGIAVCNGIAAQSMDITKEEEWSKEVRDLCVANNIMAIHSTPVFGKDGNVVASFPLLFEEPRKPNKWEYQLAEFGAHIASVAIDRDQSDKALRKSEKWSRQLLEKLPAAAYTCDSEGRITYFNEQAAEVWGREPELNDPLDSFCGSVQLYLPDGSPISHNECWMALALKNEEEYNEKEIIIERPDGQRITGLAYISPIHDESGELIGAINIVVDIGKRKQMEEALRESEEKYHTLFDSMPVAGFVCDTSGVLQYYNDRAAELWGRKPKCGDPKEKYCGSFKLYLPDGTHLPHSQSPMVEVLRDGEPIHNVEVYIEQPEGSRIPVMVNFSPLKNMKGEVEGVITSFEDISVLKRTEKELQEINDTLEERVEKRTKKLRSLASQLNKAEERERQRLASELHDNLGQMLTVAKMQVDGLQYNNIPDYISPEVKELNKVVDDALKYNQNLMAELKPPPVLDKQDVTEVLRWTAKKIEKEGLDITIEDDGQPKPVDKEIRSVLHQSVRELLRNVVKHADTNEARLLISSDNDQVKIMVEDKGKGFNMKKKRPAPTEGGRFGLFNIQERMDWHGGTFDIHSEPGKGTKATLYAPLKEKVKLDKFDRDVKDTPPPSDKKMEQANLDQKIRIMLVDDHDMVRRGLRQMIEKQDDLTIVAEASDGREAVELAHAYSPDVIVMDVNMPVMDGIEATQKIKSDMPNVPIIGLSLHDSEEVIQDMQNAGASGYLTKDEAFETLCVTIWDEVSASKK